MAHATPTPVKGNPVRPTPRPAQRRRRTSAPAPLRWPRPGSPTAVALRIYRLKLALADLVE